MSKYFINIFRVIFTLLLFSCDFITIPEKVENKPIKNNKVNRSNPVNMLNASHRQFSILFEKLDEYLPVMYPNCTEFKVAYKEITQEEKEYMVIYFEWMKKYTLDNFPQNDSSIFFQDYLFTDLKYYQPTIEYDPLDSCSFYCGVVYHSSDFNIQFIRLFQKDRVESMDLYLDLSGNEPKILGFG